MSLTICLDQGLSLALPTVGSAVWNKLLVEGTFFRADFPKGITLTRGDLETMVANWKAMGSRALRFDYHHQGGSEADGQPRQNKEASGWIEQLELRDDGLWGLVKWTAEARDLIRADKYRYLSPEFALNALNRKTGKPQGPTLIAAGLLNDPFLTDLPRVAASAVPTPTAPAATEQQMNKIALAALAILGLTETATEEQVAQKAKELADERARGADALKMSAGVEPLKVQMAALQENNKALQAKTDALEQAARKADIDGLVAVLMNDGKEGARITASQQAAVRTYAEKVGVAEARAFFMAGPIILKLGEQGHGGSADPVDAQGAYVKLQAAAADLVKNGCQPADALIRAMELNPELTKATASLTSPRS